METTDTLLPTNSPIAENQGAVSAFEFDSGNERNTVSLTKIKNFSFSAGTGGTLVLGGQSNDNGLLQIRDSSKNLIIQGDNLGMHFYDNAGTEQIKVDVTGLHAYDSGGTEQIKVDVNGFHGLSNSGGTLVTVDDVGFHAYGTSGTELVTVDVDAFHAYNSIGSQVLSIGTAGLVGYGTQGSVITIRASVGGVAYGRMGYNSSNGFWVVGTPTLFLEGQNKISQLSVVNEQFATDSSGSAWRVGATGGGIDMRAHTDVSVTAVSNINMNCADFKINGASKSAIVPTKKGYKALYTNESPDVWFMDFCDTKDKIDPLFLEITSPPYHFIKCEDGEYQVWGKRKGFETTRFEDKTEEQFNKNNDFWNMPNA